MPGGRTSVDAAGGMGPAHPLVSCGLNAMGSGPCGRIPSRAGQARRRKDSAWGKGSAVVGVNILGIDPGIALTGYGLVGLARGKAEARVYGTIRTDGGETMDRRLFSLFSQLEELLDRHQPDQVAVEQLFFNKNARSALTVGQARGVALVACAHRHKPVAEYTPLQVKQAVAGYGRASKSQIQEMVRCLLRLDETPRPADAADALAVALCHAFSYPLLTRLERMQDHHV